MLIDPLLEDRDRPGIAVDRDPLTTDDPRRDVPSPHDGGDAVLARNDRAVGEDAANVRHQARRLGE